MAYRFVRVAAVFTTLVFAYVLVVHPTMTAMTPDTTTYIVAGQPVQPAVSAREGYPEWVRLSAQGPEYYGRIADVTQVKVIGTGTIPVQEILRVTVENWLGTPVLAYQVRASAEYQGNRAFVTAKLNGAPEGSAGVSLRVDTGPEPGQFLLTLEEAYIQPQQIRTVALLYQLTGKQMRCFGAASSKTH